MNDKIPVTFENDSPAPSQEEELDNGIKTRLRERSMKAEHNYPGVQR